MGNPVNIPTFKDHYDNYINGQFTPPTEGKYFDVITPITGKVFTKNIYSKWKEMKEKARNSELNMFNF